MAQQKEKDLESTLSSISRMLFKTHGDEYYPRISRQVATNLKSSINNTPKNERKTEEFVEDIRRNIQCLHEYNVEIAKKKFKYPRSKQLDALLIKYVELECELLYSSYKEVDERYENEVQQRVLRLLNVILYDAIYNGEAPRKDTIRACDKALLNLFVKVRADCKTDNKIVANVILKLLNKLGLLEEINELKGVNIPIHQDTCLRDPLVSTIWEKLATSDYEPDSDDSDGELDKSVVNDDIFHSNSSAIKSFQSQAPHGNEVHVAVSDVVKVSQSLTNCEPQSSQLGEKENVQIFNSFNAKNNTISKNLTLHLDSCRESQTITTQDKVPVASKDDLSTTVDLSYVSCASVVPLTTQKTQAIEKKNPVTCYDIINEPTKLNKEPDVIKPTELQSTRDEEAATSVNILQKVETVPDKPVEVTKEVSLPCDVAASIQSTSSYSTAGLQEKNCLFSYDEDAEIDNHGNLDATALFDGSLGLEDISPSKLPISGNPSLDLISPTSIAEISSSMKLVQILGPYNYTMGDPLLGDPLLGDSLLGDPLLGDPLLGGNNEDKNITNSSEEFELNESHLDEFQFNIEENGTLDCDDLRLFLPSKKKIDDAKTRRYPK